MTAKSIRLHKNLYEAFYGLDTAHRYLAIALGLRNPFVLLVGMMKKSVKRKLRGNALGWLKEANE